MLRQIRVSVIVVYAVLSMAIALLHFNMGDHPASWWMALVPPFVVCMLAPRMLTTRGLFFNGIGLSALLGMFYWGFWLREADKWVPLSGFILHLIAAGWAFKMRFRQDQSASGVSSGP